MFGVGVLHMPMRGDTLKLRFPQVCLRKPQKHIILFPYFDSTIASMTSVLFLVNVMYSLLSAYFIAG